jgi:choline monooxygenase
MIEDLFSPEHYIETRRPLNQASGLPWWCYISPDWHEREMDAIFHGANAEWIAICREEQIARAGDYLCFNLVGRPLIVARNDDGEIRAFSAVCRHRGATVVEEGLGHRRAFACPYHGWTYSLSGELVSTPGKPAPMEGVEGFEKTNIALDPVRVGRWGGFVFVTYNTSAPPVTEWLGDLPTFLKNYALETMQFTHRDIYQGDFNWKLWLENGFEPYHSPTVHGSQMDSSQFQLWEFEMPKGPWEAMYSRESWVTYDALPPIESLTDDQRKTAYHLWVQPNLHLILTPAYMKFRQYFPEGPERMRVIESWTFPKDTIALSDFQSTVGPDYYRKYAQVIDEDLRTFPRVHMGLKAGIARPGRYSLQERLVHRIANYLLDRVVGPAGDGTSTPRNDVGDAPD